jgi:glycosyltransferase involved in cell wall biosynthesis
MSADLEVRVAAVIPTWNEARSIAPLLVEMAQLPPGMLRWIVVADGGSTDGTPEIARARGAEVVIQRQRGYGAACWEGFCAARDLGATYVLFLDGDGADPPNAIPRLLESLLAEQTQLAIGVRLAVKGVPDPMPWHARFGNRLVCRLLYLRTGRRVSDLPSMKALSVADLEALEMREMGFGWTTELIGKALKRGYSVAEVPVAVRLRTAGQSKISGNLNTSARAAVALIRTAITATA